MRWTASLLPMFAALDIPTAAATALPLTAGAVSDKVAALPGWAAALPSAHFSGYLPVANGEKMLHYYLQEADTDPKNKPLVLWMNGGPGASSMIGAFTELGQLIFNRDSASTASTEGGSAPTLFRNPYSWTTSANVLYLESPAGVGYSYCVDPENKCSNTDNSSAVDGHTALLGFFERFPAFKERKFYLTGESYAGVRSAVLVQQPPSSPVPT